MSCSTILRLALSSRATASLSCSRMYLITLYAPTTKLPPPRLYASATDVNACRPPNDESSLSSRITATAATPSSPPSSSTLPLAFTRDLSTLLLLLLPPLVLLLDCRRLRACEKSLRSACASYVASRGERAVVSSAAAAAVGLA